MDKLTRHPEETARRFASRCKLRGLSCLALGDEQDQARRVFLEAVRAETEAFLTVETPSPSEIENFATEVMGCLKAALVETKSIPKLPNPKRR